MVSFRSLQPAIRAVRDNVPAEQGRAAVPVLRQPESEDLLGTAIEQYDPLRASIEMTPSSASSTIRMSKPARTGDEVGRCAILRPSSKISAAPRMTREVPLPTQTETTSFAPIDENGRQKNRAEYDHLTEAIDMNQIHANLHDGDHQRAQKRAADAAWPPPRLVPPTTTAVIT